MMSVAIIVLIFFCLFAFFALYVSAEIVPIQLNVNCSIYTSIESISHDAETREVFVELRGRRRCFDPTFLARLSGTALYLLDLVHHERPPDPTSMTDIVFRKSRSNYTFKYPPIVDPGKYFLEIIVLYCVPFNPNDYKSLCAEDPNGGNNVINMPYEVDLKASSSADIRQNLTHRGHWLRKPSPGNKTVSLPTRYQRLAGGGDSLTEHHKYHWVNGADWRDTFRTMNVSRVHMCLVGDSHSRFLADYGQAIDALESGNVTFERIEVHYPRYFNMTAIHDAKCDYAIVTMAQWPACIVDPAVGDVYTARQYAQEMRGIAEQISPANYTGSVKWFFRSENYNGLKLAVTACPPRDYRAFPLLEANNKAVHKIAADHHIGYIDLDPVIRPMWDSAKDYSHPELVFPVEIGWILQYVFKHAPM
jgi:hypothetical protein